MAASPRHVLRHLARSPVDFVVIGGVAVNAQGYIRTTEDLDITYATTPTNLEELGAVLVALDARLRGVTEVVPFVPDARTLHHTELLSLSTSAGDLDLLAAPPGAPPYEQLKAKAERVELDGASVRMASLEDLVAMKRAAGRPLDLVDIEALEAIQRLRNENS